ncbi:putative bifunctional diguanylate cyclase/phosphodiesterase [Roseibium sp.]|uniref:putative bifunctional diguanylate cyclase/phosphodiesterase n=1 Tax=Roseibium sp. TaxID=1936156 RepID=UPI003BADA542
MSMDFLVPPKSQTNRVAKSPWKILVVDDDPDVHDVTRIAVDGCDFEDRPFELLHALSAEEARACLSEHDDIAVALIDVVMENDTAGLGLVSWIRSELGNSFTRLILRTGQPGYAPQTDVIMKFDVDGYAEKAELSRTKLITAIVTALRGYKLVLSLETNRQRLKQLNTQLSAIVEKNALSEFAALVLENFSDLAGEPVDGLLCGLESLSQPGSAGVSNVRVLAASGAFEDKLDLPLDVIGEDLVRKCVSECIVNKTEYSTSHGVALPLITRNGLSGALFIGLPLATLNEKIGSEIIRLFVSNVALGYEKTGLLEHIRNLAYVDRTTGQSTFSGFLEAFQSQAAAEHPLLVIHCDIQRFRFIVDGIGDEKAAAVLKQTGHRLSQTFPDALAIARKEKDEFLILLRGGLEVRIQDIVARIEESFQEPIAIDENQISLKLRCGIATADEGEHSAEEIVRHASIALNDVRQKGLTNHAVFHPLMQEAALERLRLASLLTGKGAQAEFSLSYQPIMQASDESIAAFEALMRFRTASGATLNTMRMIEAAETSGLIVEIGAWMFRSAFSEFSSLKGVSERVRLNVNLSPRQVQAGRIYKDIEDAAASAGLGLDRLVFEVTEGLFVNNDQVTLSVLTWLRNKGAKVVIDDFGTGYSSFSYLRKLPLDGIKIDRSFIMNMEQDPDALAVVRSIIAVAKALDLSITAEGVETAEQRKIMQELECDFLQGYLFSKPLPSSGLDAFVTASNCPDLAAG